MSSVKRTNVAPSEHGQSKAPDKWDTSSKTANASAANNISDTCDTMSSSAAKNQTQQQSRDAQKSANSTQQVTKVTNRTTTFRMWLNIFAKSKWIMEIAPDVSKKTVLIELHTKIHAKSWYRMQSSNRTFEFISFDCIYI